MVELLGGYSNQNIVTKLRQVLAGQGRDQPTARTTRSQRRNRSLNENEVHELLTSYTNGTPIDQVATDFGIHRTTALNIVRRSNVERRWHVIDQHLDQARELYEEGSSLKKVGAHFGVSADTVRLAFQRNGIPIRPRPGRS